MEKQSRNEIVAFPELFDGIEQFTEEQARGIKKTSAFVAVVAMLCGMLLAWWLNRVA